MASSPPIANVFDHGWQVYCGTVDAGSVAVVVAYSPAADWSSCDSPYEDRFDAGASTTRMESSAPELSDDAAFDLHEQPSGCWCCSRCYHPDMAEAADYSTSAAVAERVSSTSSEAGVDSCKWSSQLAPESVAVASRLELSSR